MSGSEATGVMVVTYGDFKIADFDQLPLASKIALATSGLSHKLGNEVASEVSANMDDAIMSGRTDKPSKEEMKRLRAEWKSEPANLEQYENWKKELTQAAFQDILEGKVGTRASGPRGPKLNEFEALCREIAYDEIGEFLVGKAFLAKNKAGDFVIPNTNRKPVSSGKNIDKLVTIGGLELTMAQLVDRRLAHEKFGPAIQESATKRLEAKRRALAKSVDMTAELESML